MEKILTHAGQKSGSGKLPDRYAGFGDSVPGVFTPVLAKHSKSFNLIDFGSWEKGIPAADDLESVQCVHVCIQRARPHSTIQGDSEARRIP